MSLLILGELVCGRRGSGEGHQELAGVLGLIGEEVQGGWGCSPIQVLDLLLIFVGMGVLQQTTAEFWLALTHQHNMRALGNCQSQATVQTSQI